MQIKRLLFLLSFVFTGFLWGCMTKPVHGLANQLTTAEHTSLWVNDQANVLSDQTLQTVDELNNDRLERLTGHPQYAVITVDHLPKETNIADYAHDVFHQYAFGHTHADNGLLLLLAIKERTFRIQTGYGLEAALPDSATDAAVTSSAKNALRTKNYDLAVTLISHNLLAQLQRADDNHQLTALDQNDPTTANDRINQSGSIRTRTRHRPRHTILNDWLTILIILALLLFRPLIIIFHRLGCRLLEYRNRRYFNWFLTHIDPDQTTTTLERARYWNNGDLLKLLHRESAATNVSAATLRAHYQILAWFKNAPLDLNAGPVSQLTEATKLLLASPKNRTLTPKEREFLQNLQGFSKYEAGKILLRYQQHLSNADKYQLLMPTQSLPESEWADYISRHLPDADANVARQLTLLILPLLLADFRTINRLHHAANQPSAGSDYWQRNQPPHWKRWLAVLFGGWILGSSHDYWDDDDHHDSNGNFFDDSGDSGDSGDGGDFGGGGDGGDSGGGGSDGSW